MAKARVHQEISPFVVRAFLALILAAWLLNIVSSSVFAVQQLASNPNLSSYYTTFLYSLFLPLVSFCIFMAWKRRKSGAALVTESLFLTLIVYYAVTLVAGISHFVLTQFQVTLAGNLGWWYLEVMVCLVTSMATFAVLWYAHRLGKW